MIDKSHKVDWEEAELQIPADMGLLICGARRELRTEITPADPQPLALKGGPEARRHRFTCPALRMSMFILVFFIAGRKAF